MDYYYSLWQNSSSRLSPSDIVVPVQFHVIRETSGAKDVSDERIFDQLDALNERYRASRFKFFLRGIDRTNNSTWAAASIGSTAEPVMKSSLAIDISHTMNVYLCPDIPGGVLGWAYFPPDYPENSTMHGIVVLSDSLPGGATPNFNLGMSLVHESGHYLGLFHTFQGQTCAPADPGDHVADTPQHSRANFGKPPANTDTCPASPGYDPVHNYMNYADDDWMTEFTSGQFDRAYGELSNGRPTLWNAGISNNTSTLANISTRLRVEDGGNAAIAGFYLTGSGTRPVLVRANGPWLNNFGLSGLADPTLNVTTSGGSAVAANDDWKNPLSNQMAVQSTPYPPHYDVESAIKLDLPVGGFTAIMVPKTGTANGVGLIEVYDLASGTQPNRIVNISTRGLVGSGSNAMIGGFVISGGYKEVLIRGIGPTLGAFGISNPLANPKITLVKLVAGQSVVVGTNFSWVTAKNYNQIVADISQTGAFSVSNTNEAMMVKILDSGSYTVITEPESGAEGVAITEIYDVNAY